MKVFLFLAVLCGLTLADAAPLQTQELTRAVERATSLTKKILSDIPAAHRACVKTTVSMRAAYSLLQRSSSGRGRCCSAGLTLSSEAEHLEYLFSDLGIPAPPVLKSEDLSMDVSLSRIVAGLELHRELLQDITELLSSTEELTLLLADIRDLSDQIYQMQQLAQTPSTVSQKAAFTALSPRLNSDYRVQVAIHLSLRQLRSFTQDVFRSLRHIAASN
ncbi:colony stimulating factor 3 (granulocyte) b isoform X1 [Onychostoma macrolepis]|uniref:colony stimulating factor 3 (granulocyte) b isoform X1 n=1 Tax=Onychostoma macrolepis TaxID=369639 RepID=UPI00272C1092|nr:colony stimulating factor 3 (granulocyte) b isoform X1 [Onychostoma macrolepis]